MKILMIEDNESVCEMMSMFFDNEGFDASFYYDGLEGFEAYAQEPAVWDMVLLDLNLPSMDGVTIARKIREISKATPIIMLTALDSESDQVLGLEMGADDYVTKPFSPLTLLARMKALHRRASLSSDSGDLTPQGEFDIQTSHVRINTTTREAYVYDHLVDDLTPKEFDLLVTMAKQPKRVYTREQLLEIIWQDPFYVDTRLIDAHIKKLRHKLDAYGPEIIHTVWGVGYKFDDASER